MEPEKEWRQWRLEKKSQNILLHIFSGSTRSLLFPETGSCLWRHASFSWSFFREMRSLRSSNFKLAAAAVATGEEDEEEEEDFISARQTGSIQVCSNQSIKSVCLSVCRSVFRLKEIGIDRGKERTAKKSLISVVLNGITSCCLINRGILFYR